MKIFFILYLTSQDLTLQLANSPKTTFLMRLQTLVFTICPGYITRGLRFQMSKLCKEFSNFLRFIIFKAIIVFILKIHTIKVRKMSKFIMIMQD
jgi:hypothetical protein